jgi:hypothetical protein
MSVRREVERQDRHEERGASEVSGNTLSGSRGQVAVRNVRPQIERWPAIRGSWVLRWKGSRAMNIHVWRGLCG